MTTSLQRSKPAHSAGSYINNYAKEKRRQGLISKHTTLYDTLLFSFLPAPGKRNLAESLYWGKRGKHEQFRIFYLLSEKIEN
jgi:hypothetical protein